MMEISTTECIIEKAEDVCSDDDKYPKFIKKKWVVVDDVLLDMKSWLEANDFAELKQCVSDFINELEENQK